MALPMRVTVSPDRVDADPGDAVNIEVTVHNGNSVRLGSLVHAVSFVTGSRHL